MTVIIELKPEVEERAKAEAEALGLPVEDYLESVIESRLVGSREKPLSENAMPAERGRAWEDWAAGHSPDTPVILRDDRDVIYGDDGR
jgi:hypothetical protein